MRAPVLCLTLLTCAYLGAQTGRSPAIDAIFQAWNQPHSPGAAVAVIDHGRVVLEQGYGAANLEYATPITPATVFHVASVSKQFTAMAIVLLERDGKLTVDDDVRKYLPELPEYGRKITIRHLLQHVSGIRDQWQTLSTAGWSMEDVISQDQILRMLFRQQELNFPPGARHLYSNSGYTLAAEIVARVSGQPFPDFCDQRIFRPLGMTATHFHQDLHRIVPGRAYSYRPVKAGFENAPLNYANAGATSLFTTAGDLVKWLDNFRQPKVGGAAAIARLQEQAVLNDGKQIDYALGVVVGQYRGLKTVSHTGADAGFRSAVLWFPEQEWGVAVVSNLATFNPMQAAQKVAEQYLQGKLAPPKPSAAPVTRNFVTLPAEGLRPLTGTYHLLPVDQYIETIFDEGKLWALPSSGVRGELRALGPNRFYVSEIDAEMVFTPQSGGGMAVKVTQPGGVNTGARQAPLAPFTAELAGQYAGLYRSAELETQYRMELKGGKLVAVHAHHGEIPLQRVAVDAFRSERFFFQTVQFLRGAKGEVTGFTVGGGRVSAIRFEKQ